MGSRILIFLLLYVVSFWIAGSSLAATLRPSVLVGLMAPPSSQYYHYVYGGQVDLARRFDTSLVRVQYLQRPAFTETGYTDQDFSALAMLGTSVLGKKEFGVTALFGGGYVWGYIKASENPDDKNSYKLPGLAVALEARWSPKLIDVRFAHQVLVAHESKDQLKAYVAWPFNWFVLSASYPISIGGRSR
jgi:hypothetical protein